MAEIIAQNSKKSGRVILAIVLVIVAVAIVYFIWNSFGAVKPVAVETPVISPAGNKLPEGFLSGLPIESGVEFKESYSTAYPTDKTKVQRTVSYYSSKDMSQTFQLFLDYVQSNNWTIINKDEGLTLIKFLYARKDGNDLNLTFVQDQTVKKVLVTISYLTSAASK